MMGSNRTGVLVDSFKMDADLEFNKKYLFPLRSFLLA